MNINRGFEIAKEASKLSDYKKKNIKIGSTIIYKNKVLTIGWNTSKTNPLQAYYNKYREDTSDGREFISDEHLPCVHSELMSLINTRNMDIDWSKASMFIYRKNGTCKPCKACEQALKDRGIKKVFYTTNNGWEVLDD